MFTVRRAHDLGRSGWYLLWSIVPLVNIYIAIRISFIEGEKGPNRFGPDPLTTPGRGENNNASVSLRYFWFGKDCLSNFLLEAKIAPIHHGCKFCVVSFE